jgi:sarcosine oxidase subunit beta
MATRTADTVVVGGGIIGAATGYYLAKLGHKVVLLERSYPCSGGTGRCIGGIRAQFTHDLSIRVMVESIRLFSDLNDEFGETVHWHQGGYLFLAFDKPRKQAFLDAIKIQHTYGLDVEFISSAECGRIVPGLDRKGLLGGAYCPTDGQADPFLATYGYLSGIKRLGGEVRVDTEVTGINTRGNKVVSVETSKGDKVFAPNVLNAAGSWSDEIGRMVGLNVPVAPDRHESLVTEAAERLFDPMLVDYRSDGCYFVQHVGTGHFVGCYTPVPLVPGRNVDATDEFITEMPRRMVRLVPKLGHVKVLRQWAGSYCMAPDGSPICGATPVEGFHVSSGMSGHGFMFGPALGKLMAELIACGEPSMPLDQFAPDREFGKAEGMK